MKKRIVMLAVVAFCVGAVVPMVAFGQSGATNPNDPVSVAVFVPGVVAGSPLYEQLVNGAKKVQADYPGLTLKVVEGGFDQSKWTEQVMSLAATGQYKFIVSSNMSMPDVEADVADAFPNQKFIDFDAYRAPGNPQFYTLMYNQVEQGYIAGYMAGLVTTSSMPGANSALKVGAIVAQEYPALTGEMIPGYKKGFEAVNPNITLDYRVIGNWYDANKAADLTNSMIDSGVDVVLSISGGAGQGIIKAAQKRGKYVLYFDEDVYHLAPGTIIGCAILRQEQLVVDILKKALDGTLQFGTANVADARGGFVDFADSDPLWTNNVPADVRAKMEAMVKKLRSGELQLPIPSTYHAQELVK